MSAVSVVAKAAIGNGISVRRVLLVDARVEWDTVDEVRSVMIVSLVGTLAW